MRDTVKITQGETEWHKVKLNDTRWNWVNTYARLLLVMHTSHSTRFACFNYCCLRASHTIQCHCWRHIYQTQRQRWHNQMLLNVRRWVGELGRCNTETTKFPGACCSKNLDRYDVTMVPYYCMWNPSATCSLHSTYFQSCQGKLRGRVWLEGWPTACPPPLSHRSLTSTYLCL